MWSIPSSVTARTVAVSLLLAHQSTAVVGSPGKGNLNSYLAAHPVSTQTAVPSDFTINTLPPSVVSLITSRCPASCDESGLNPNNWTVYHQSSRLSKCNQTVLLDFALYNSLDNPRTQQTIRSCTAKFATGARSASNGTNDGLCLPNGNLTQVQESLQLAFNETSTPGSVVDFEAASQQLAGFLAEQEPTCNDTIAFTYSNSVAVGLFAGSGVQGISASVLQQFIAQVKSSGFSESALVQLCAANNRSSKYSFGIIANAENDISFVQDAVATWASGECITAYDSAEAWQNITLKIPSLLDQTNSTFSSRTSGNSTLANRSANGLRRRDSCTTIQVVSGDSCASLAAECGISPADFTTYNPSSTLCSTLSVGEHVCCSAGTLPDFAPSPNSDGTCASYLVVSGDTCSAIAASYSLTLEDLANFNTDTWGWMGCTDLQAGGLICLSTGAPPMPASISNAVCGPQKLGTLPPATGISLASLNPCPLNACCDIFGQCGTTPDFCTITQSPTGAPGTAAVGTYGCISNCGTDIVVGSAPSVYKNVGFFEAFNSGRPCLNMPITSMDLSSYTHIHLSFAVATTSFALDVSAIQSQFDLFAAMTGFKKILSIGGWSFSTDPGTYSIFRAAVTPANQDTFVANIVSFVEEYELDGIDIDWEYPAEPDIPGIPAGTSADADNYVTFLTKLRAAMPFGTSISVCAPASFWYLQGFHIQAMAPLVDYVVFMTYDIHGQWDYGNPYSDIGCPTGNCLRSDVNLTETLLALSMVTKAGVPSNQIVVGVTSYGRSFQMTTAGCYTAECTYTGIASGAFPGPCTQTGGYIANAEINSILDGTGTVLSPDGSAVAITGSPFSYFDSDSYSNIAVYDDTQWVGYMDDSNKADRKALYQTYNFGGTADWAIDLQSFTGDTNSGSAGSAIVLVDPDIWTETTPEITCEPPCILVLPPYPLSSTQTVSWPSLTTTLLSSSAGSVYVVTTTISVPAFTITDVSLQPITVQATDTGTYVLDPVQSITPSSFVITLPPNEATFPPTTPAPPASTTTSTGGPLLIIPPVIFYTTPVPVTIQPQPTYSVTYPPPPKPLPPITISRGPTPTPTGCTGPGCPSRNCDIFGCEPGCGIFGCNGGCGIFGCGGGCGVFGCSAGCPLGLCGGLGCLIPGGCGNTQGPGGGDSNNDCDDPVTASACTYIVSSYSEPPMADYSTTTSTDCTTSTACFGEDTATTTTEGDPACSLNPTAYVADQAAAGTAVDGTTIPLGFYPTDPPDWDGSTLTVSQFGLSTVTVVVTSTSTVTPTTTVTVVVPPTVTADCASWIELDMFYVFEVYNIQGWSMDGGSSLHKQEKGCGALTGWEWDEHTSSQYSRAYFNLPFFIKSGCVERAIVSAGGPKLSCQYQGEIDSIFKKRELGMKRKAKQIKRISPPMKTEAAQMKKRAMTTDSASPPSLTYTPSYTYSSSLSSAPTYMSQSWDPNDGGTVTLTDTLTSVSTTVLTTVIVLGTSTSSSASATPTPSVDGTCGTSNGGQSCTGSGFGDCCSSSGYCGSTSEYCGTGCQSSFSTCSSVSTDGLCGDSNGGTTCVGSGFGDCCSSSGYCGSTSAYCGTGCQTAFGTCDISPDGTCGSTNSYTCAGSGFGDCCSSSGYCGSTSAYCGTGCQTAFGTCDISPDGTCGGTNGYICAGSGFGDCCSTSGYCGSTSAYCASGSCQTDFGTCDSGPPVSPDGLCGSNSSTGASCAGSSFGDCCSSSGYCGSTSAYCGTGCQSSFGTCT